MRGHQEGADIRTSDVIIQPGARAASEVSSSEQEKPVSKLCLSFGPQLLNHQSIVVNVVHHSA